MSNKLWAGVDIGGTKTAVLVSVDPPHILKRVEFATLPANGPKPAIEQIRSPLRTMVADLAATQSCIAGASLSCGSPLDAGRGNIQAPPNLSTWLDVAVVKKLANE